MENAGQPKNIRIIRNTTKNVEIECGCYRKKRRKEEKRHEKIVRIKNVKQQKPKNIALF
jgi:hypothetical protein